ncbi:aminotransferase class V-fold PLP-dependent enzyme [Chromatium okenii]|uniref:Aminotransferase n=1 Tax=Chromatium okenii TaxID=61644 RepID=A0A2S7XNV0_9GAMM|nr:aminotransferase class V-fold PLP-dependent enzyme [Chromatium okenii]PQJ95346.1 aminotransferase [Chromatium okenii]
MTIELAGEFELDAGLCHLNHAAVSPWPRRTAAAVTQFAVENARSGSMGYLRWLEMEQRLRERLARLIGANAADIALVKNTSEGLSIVAHGLPWRAGENVVGIAQEFPSNRIVWESLAAQGVTWRAVDLAQSIDPEGDLLAQCDQQTRVLAISWVQYARGLRLDLARLTAGCRERDILLCVDAIQGLGAVPFDLATSDVDVVVADGHKWLLGPEGVALLYVRPALRERLTLRQFGWRMVEHPGDFDRVKWLPGTDARRFECGSPNMLGICALEASLSLLEEIGLETIWQELQARTAYLIALLDQRGFELLTPRDPARRAGIITFNVPDLPADQLYSALMARQVLCAQRGGGIRFSPHFYTPLAVIDAAVAVIDELRE